MQAHCTPPILAGRDVINCAKTGSSKTAVIALHILYTLSQDPSIVVRCAVIAGGVDMLKQSLALQLRPHIIVATPSRFRDHLLRVNPPNISPTSSGTYSAELHLRQAAGQAADALVSAMMTPTLDRLEQTALSDDAFRSNATPSVRTADPCRNLPGCHLTK
ncbi:hypothetical protein PR001_g17290 [Phytophthora rubi]|uniref:DEAD/DEAH-box helicase domain-containing protein n=1 Tax=Phytophthora rubi TaxID=129364 RepID=A0A6A3KRI3_9STRA|nr:hypothetical protein PR002_g18112 [Phytophthora rubi]KAE9006074.1 hypothetical protein PR001_g17290 [Phytophthora rubi]